MEAKNEIGVCSANVNGEIESRILTVRGMQVMLDHDLAELYGVPTKALNQAVKRNSERFPTDFMFRLSESELEVLRSQIVTSKRGGNRYRPYAFTEHGVTGCDCGMLNPYVVSRRYSLLFPLHTRAALWYNTAYLR